MAATSPTTPSAPAVSSAGHAGSFWSHTVAMSRRAIANIYRQPAVLFSAGFFPLFFMVLNNFTLGASVDLPNFPEVDTYLQFILPGNAIQAVMFASTSAGQEMAIDIEGGFFDRLLLSPVRRTAILLGRLAGAASLGALCCLFFVAVTLPFGMIIRGGVGGVVVFALVGALLCVAFGALAVAGAVVTGSVEALQGVFPVYFVLVFLSSAFFPLELVEAEWFRLPASINPLTAVIDSTRDLIISEWSWASALRAVGIAGGFATVAVVLANVALQRKLASL